jgi:flagellar export protein FliJ
MQRSKRFEPIQQIVAASAEELAKRVAESGRRVAELDRQLTQLNSYRDEYVNSSKATQGVMDAVKLQNYRSFLDRLGEAIRQHVIKLDAARAEHEKRRVIWSDKRVEVESLGRAVERFRRQETHESEQREQRDGDEAAMRIALARIEAAKQ